MCQKTSNRKKKGDTGGKNGLCCGKIILETFAGNYWNGKQTKNILSCRGLQQKIERMAYFSNASMKK